MHDVNALNQYLTQNNLKPLISDRIVGETIYYEASLRSWIDFFAYTLTFLQNDIGPFELTQVLLEKL